MPLIAFLIALALAVPAVASEVAADGASVIGSGVDPAKLARVQSLAQTQISQDIKVEITHQSRTRVCKTDGPGFVVELKVKHLKANPDIDSGPAFYESWETVKTYRILDADVMAATNLTDDEGCWPF